MPAISVFDLDHTLTKSNASFAFGKFLYEKGQISAWAVALLISTYLLHKFGYITSADLHRISFRVIFLGTHEQTIMQYVDDFLEERFNTLIRPNAYEWLQREQANGLVVLLSASPSFLVDSIGKRLGITHTLGTRYATHQGVYAQVDEVLDGEKKLCYVKKILFEWKSTAQELTIYSDSIQDMPLFEFAGKRIAISPDRQLRKIAYKRAWTIIEG